MVRGNGGNINPRGFSSFWDFELVFGRGGELLRGGLTILLLIGVLVVEVYLSGLVVHVVFESCCWIKLRMMGLELLKVILHA